MCIQFYSNANDSKTSGKPVKSVWCFAKKSYTRLGSRYYTLCAMDYKQFDNKIENKYR